MRVADEHGTVLTPDRGMAADPSDRRARSLVFDLHIAGKDASPTASELALMREIGSIEHALQELYPEGDPALERRFRPMFVRLFFLAQLSLEGDIDCDANGSIVAIGGRLPEDVARMEVKAIAAELIDDEAPRVKSRHLRELGRWAATMAVPALLAYVLLSLAAPDDGQGQLTTLLRHLHVVPSVAANFMLLWCGTMVGVCLSYAFRTTEFGIADLTKTDSDHLPAPIRLAITGTMAMLLVLFALAGLGEIAVGATKFSDVHRLPMVALVVGAILGIGEQKLSGTVAKKAGDVLGGTT